MLCLPVPLDGAVLSAQIRRLIYSVLCEEYCALPGFNRTLMKWPEWEDTDEEELLDSEEEPSSSFP